MPETPQPLETWAIVEVMGHKKLAGFVTEQTFGGAALIRVDVPETEQEMRTSEGATTRTTQAYSKLIGVGSIYCITPCTEAVAKLAAQQILVLWLGRLLNDIALRSDSRRVERWADAVYRVYFGRQNRHARRQANRGIEAKTRNREWREHLQAIDGVIAETRPQRVGAPFHRDR